MSNHHSSLVKSSFDEKSPCVFSGFRRNMWPLSSFRMGILCDIEIRVAECSFRVTGSAVFRDVKGAAGNGEVLRLETGSTHPLNRLNLQFLTSGYVKIAIENGPVEIVDFPI